MTNIFKIQLVIIILGLQSFGFSQIIKELEYPYIAVNNTIMHKDSLCCTPYDTEDSLHQQFYTNHFTFLIKEDVYYRFRIMRIDPLNNGYGILMHTKIGGRDSYAYVITGDDTRIPKIEKLKRKKLYSIKLHRYIKSPIVRSIEYPQIYDVLIENSIIPVMSTGSFTYLFISDNLIGLNYIDSTRVSEIEKIKSNAKAEVGLFVLNFIQKVFLDRDSVSLINMTDSFMFKKTLLDISWYVGPNMINHHFSKPPKNLKKMFETAKADTSNFVNMFWYMIDTVSLFPITKEDFRIENAMVDILYYTNNIFNVRVLWKTTRSPFHCRLYLSIKKYDNGYKLIGMTKLSL